MKKQILARLLCISLIAGLLPTTMLAAEIPAQNETNTVEEAGTTVYVGGQEDITQLGHYTTITAALEALSEDTGRADHHADRRCDGNWRSGYQYPNGQGDYQRPDHQ